MFVELISDRLKENKRLLKLAFNSLNGLLVLNAVKSGGNDNEFSYEFSRFHSFNSWSHSVKLIANEEGVFLRTYRIKAKADILKYQYTTYGHNEIGCMIPITETELIVKVLTVYDSFKYKS